MNELSDIDSILRSIQGRIETDPDTTTEHSERLADLYERRESMESESFANYLDRYLTEAKRKQQAGEIETLCGCRFATCKVKAGKIPAKVKREIRKEDSLIHGDPDIEGAIQNYLLDSPHSNSVLRYALDDYRGRKGELRRDAMSLQIEVRR